MGNEAIWLPFAAKSVGNAPVVVGGGARYEWFKSTFDRVAAAVGLIVLAPIFALIAIAIRCDSPGPVIFTQKRVGKGGHPFNFYKFRTMWASSDDSLHRAAFQRFFEARSREDGGELGFKIANDPRVTRVGRWLRASSLDELPQLVNVLKGDMSLVGPRPPIPYETQLYEARHWLRLAVRPGITGAWQAGGRGTIPFEEMVALDLDYIAHRSMFLDLKILVSTVGAVLSRRGAS
jgi:lipopolysaccharide/colanic/teichoic acid biosynthesis glycosyltransferase